ncbi:hypothetical protein ACVWXM_001155 [Bradyrhizobium sp. GM7.3]
MVRAVGAVIVRVSVQCMRDELDVEPEAFFLTGRNVRIQRMIELFQSDYLDESRRSYAAIEPEYRSLVCAAGFERSLGRVCVVGDCCRLRSVLRVTVVHGGWFCCLHGPRSLRSRRGMLGAIAGAVARFASMFRRFRACRLCRSWLRSALRVAVARAGGRCGGRIDRCSVRRGLQRLSARIFRVPRRLVLPLSLVFARLRKPKRDARHHGRRRCPLWSQLQSIRWLPPSKILVLKRAAHCRDPCWRPLRRPDRSRLRLVRLQRLSARICRVPRRLVLPSALPLPEPPGPYRDARRHCRVCPHLPSTPCLPPLQILAPMRAAGCRGLHRRLSRRPDRSRLRLVRLGRRSARICRVRRRLVLPASLVRAQRQKPKRDARRHCRRRGPLWSQLQSIRRLPPLQTPAPKRASSCRDPRRRPLRRPDRSRLRPVLLQHLSARLCRVPRRLVLRSSLTLLERPRPYRDARRHGRRRCPVWSQLQSMGPKRAASCRAPRCRRLRRWVGRSRWGPVDETPLPALIGPLFDATFAAAGAVAL